MKLENLPVAEGLVGFLLIFLVATFVAAGDVIGSPDHTQAGSPTATEPPASGSPSPGELAITMTDNKFDKTELTVPANTDASVSLANHGAAIHNVHVAKTDGTYPATFCTVGGETPCSNPARISGGGTGVLEFNLPAGDYPFRCDYHPAEMKGTLKVE